MGREVKLFMFRIGTESLFKLKEPAVKAEGIIGAVNEDPNTWGLLFKSENDAKIARNQLEYLGADLVGFVEPVRVDEALVKDRL